MTGSRSEELAQVADELLRLAETLSVVYEALVSDLSRWTTHEPPSLEDFVKRLKTFLVHAIVDAKVKEAFGYRDDLAIKILLSDVEKVKEEYFKRFEGNFVDLARRVDELIPRVEEKVTKATLEYVRTWVPREYKEAKREDWEEEEHYGWREVTIPDFEEFEIDVEDDVEDTDDVDEGFDVDSFVVKNFLVFDHGLRILGPYKIEGIKTFERFLNSLEKISRLALYGEKVIAPYGKWICVPESEDIFENELKIDGAIKAVRVYRSGKVEVYYENEEKARRVAELILGKR